MSLGSWAEITGDIGAVAQELIENKGQMYGHDAHYKGATLGMVIAFLLDMLRGSGVPKPTRWALAPVITWAIMYGKQNLHPKN